MRRDAVILALVMLVAAGSAPVTAAQTAAPAPTDTLISFTMPDQFDRLHTDAELRGRVMLVMWVDRKGNDHRRRWVRVLERQLRDDLDAGVLGLQRVAQGQGVPGFVKGRVTTSFRDEVTEPVLMDWQGEFARAYAPRDDHVNLLVFDADGRLVHRAAGTRLEQAVLDGVVDAVRAAIADGPPGAPSWPER